MKTNNTIDEHLMIQPLIKQSEGIINYKSIYNLI